MHQRPSCNLRLGPCVQQSWTVTPRIAVPLSTPSRFSIRNIPVLKLVDPLPIFVDPVPDQFEGLEDLVSNLHDILPLILQELPQGVAAESAEDQDQVLMLLSSIARVPEGLFRPHRLDPPTSVLTGASHFS
jgi:hypothetical protein